ncbi:MAG: glycosyltransferase family 4 protein [Proteobacteria bacterium]|nr:glycosyltransferase family 4 protein [Pseudomonadota bacterium]
MTAMRVLYLMYNGLMRPSGEQSLNFHRLRALEWAGARTWVAAQEAPEDMTEERMAEARTEVAAFAPSAETLFYRRRAAWPRKMAGELTKLCREQAIQLLIFTQVQNLMAVRAVKRGNEVPVLWDCRAGADARILAGGGLIRKAKNSLFRRGYGPAAAVSDHMVVVSENHAEHMAARFGYPREKMTVVPNATDTEAFRPDAARRQATREKLGLSPDQPVVVYCGRVQPWQCLPESIGLFEQIRQARPDAHLLVLTPEVREASALIGAHLDADAYSITTARHGDVPIYLAAADIGLLLRRPTPRNAVASPTKFAEYIACGLPIAIGPGVGDYSELVADRRLGLVIDSDSPDTWPSVARELLSLVEDEAKETTRRCRETAVEILSVPRQREWLISAVAKAIGMEDLMEAYSDR